MIVQTEDMLSCEKDIARKGKVHISLHPNLAWLGKELSSTVTSHTITSLLVSPNPDHCPNWVTSWTERGCFSVVSASATKFAFTLLAWKHATLFWDQSCILEDLALFPEMLITVWTFGMLAHVWELIQSVECTPVPQTVPVLFKLATVLLQLLGKKNKRTSFVSDTRGLSYHHLRKHGVFFFLLILLQRNKRWKRPSGSSCLFFFSLWQYLLCFLQCINFQLSSVVLSLPNSMKHV